jgi:hypothetical protein
MLLRGIESLLNTQERVTGIDTRPDARPRHRPHRRPDEPSFGLNTKFELVSSSRVLRRLLDCRASDLLGAAWLEFFRPDERETLRRQGQRAIEIHFPFTVPVTCRPRTRGALAFAGTVRVEPIWTPETQAFAGFRGYVRPLASPATTATETQSA